MLAFYLGSYTLALALLWGLFVVAKIHAYKFKNFSKNIVKVTNLLLFVLLFLSILGYILIFVSVNNSPSAKVSDYGSFDSTEVNY